MPFTEKEKSSRDIVIIHKTNSTHSSSKRSSSSGRRSTRSTEDRDDSSYTDSLPSSTNEGPSGLIYSWKEDSKHYDENDSNIAVFDAAVTPETRKKLDDIIDDIIVTEKDYVSRLEYVLTNYMPCMDSDSLAPVLKGKKNVLFGNVKRIYEFHKRFFAQDLESFRHNPLQIGRCFLKWERQFNLYALYKKNKPKSDQLWEDYAHIFFQEKKKELSDELDLASYLQKPVQRLDKYVKFLQDITSCCDPEDPRGKEITDAYDLMTFQVRHGNDLVAMDAIVNADINLKEQGCLLRQADFSVHDGGRQRMRRVFLFEQALIFTKMKKTKEKIENYSYKHSIKTVDMGLTENIGERGLKFEVWYRRRKKGRSNEAFVLQASSTDIKKAWTDDITQILWRQTTRNKEYGLTEASTGISVESTPSSIFIDHGSSTFSGSNLAPYARSRSVPGERSPSRGSSNADSNDLEPVSEKRTFSLNIKPEKQLKKSEQYITTPPCRRDIIRTNSEHASRQLSRTELM